MSDPRNISEPPTPADPVNQPLSKVAPWTSESPQVPGPAPMIDLDDAMNPESVKPLGPRRLARLQRQMAEHVREIQEANPGTPGEVDPELLIRQQRLAELALRAAAANEEDRQAASEALRSAEADQGEEVTVVFPENSVAASTLAAEPVASDPSQYPSPSGDITSGPGTTSIQVFAHEASEAPEMAGAAHVAEWSHTGESTAPDAEEHGQDVAAEANPVDADVETIHDAEGGETGVESVENQSIIEGEEWTPEDEPAESVTSSDPDEVTAAHESSQEEAAAVQDDDPQVDHDAAVDQGVDPREDVAAQASEIQESEIQDSDIHDPGTPASELRDPDSGNAETQESVLQHSDAPGFQAGSGSTAVQPLADPDARYAAPEGDVPGTGGAETPSVATSSSQENLGPSVPADQVNPPALPVRALDAEGLELLEPHDYRQSSGALVPLLLLLFVLLAALVVLLIMFVL